MKTHHLAPVLTLVLSAILLGACSGGDLGTGVVLWSTEELNASPGELIRVLEENRSTDSYLVQIDDQRPQSISRFRIQLFDTQEQAEQFAEEFSDVAPLYARSRQRALPVRNRPDTDSRAVYRLQEDELVKVLEVAEEEVTISGLTGRWHRVLTETGSEGWSFGYSLNVYDVHEGLAANDRDSDIPSLGQEVLDNVWRPSDYYDLVNDNTPVIEELDPEYGLFPDEDTNTIHFKTPDFDEELSYAAITASGANHIRFQGTRLEIRRDGRNRLTAFLTTDDGEFTVRLRSLSRDLEDILEREKERREEAIETFHAEGRRLGSSVYGEVRVDEDGRFTWDDLDELRPDVVPPHYGRSGTMAFRYFPSRNLRAQYDGVVSFQFDEAPEDERISFLYELEGNGIRLTYVPLSQIRDFQVLSDSASSLVMFMNYFEPAEESDASS